MGRDNKTSPGGKLLGIVEGQEASQDGHHRRMSEGPWFSNEQCFTLLFVLSPPVGRGGWPYRTKPCCDCNHGERRGALTPRIWLHTASQTYCCQERGRSPARPVGHCLNPNNFTWPQRDPSATLADRDNNKTSSVSRVHTDKRTRHPHPC